MPPRKSERKSPVDKRKKTTVSDTLSDNDESMTELAEAAVEFNTNQGGQTRTKMVRVVGIGASAGGLEPLELLFSAMPTDLGMAYVVVQHLSPDFRSLMDELLARHTTMPINRVRDKMVIEPNAIYLIPPRKEMVIRGERLLLSDRSLDHNSLTLPIDIFMRSLAEARGEDAIGIILSGTGTDGCRGSLAIKESQGLVIVQEPKTAKFDGMPRSVIDADGAHVISSPSDIPALLKQFLSGTELRDINGSDGTVALDPTRRILDLLRRRFGPEFGYYKWATVSRRIKRRALLKRINDLGEYAHLLASDDAELNALYSDLLIGVTTFFRDREAFKALQQHVISVLADRMDSSYQTRVWVAACATGEEAYSIAMMFAEHARLNQQVLNLKIFATDIHQASLEIASQGLYSADALRDLDPDLISRYFEAEGDRYRISAHLRRLIVFSAHNLIEDPPFTRMDLVTCRNFLIYLGSIAQRKVVALFHFAMRVGGMMFLGTSETPGELTDEFATLDSKWRIYSKRHDIRLRESTHLLPSIAPVEANRPRAAIDRSNAVSTGRQLQPAYDSILSKYAPPGLLIGLNSELLHTFGDANRYMSLHSGAFSSRLPDLIRDELRIAVTTAVDRVLRHGITVATKGIPLAHSDDEKRGRVDIQVEPLSNTKDRQQYVLVTFHEPERMDGSEAPGASEQGEAVTVDSSELSSAVSARIRQLEHDLRTTEDSLQTTIEELETSNEELQATNEEMMASNEELQSTNEELHSVNEELYTVSAEHQRKIEELSQLTQDMDNLLRSTDIGTIFVDTNSRIREYTPAVAKTFNLMSHDIGRSIEHVTYRFHYPKLHEQIKAVLETGKSSEHEVEVDQVGSFLMRLNPYRDEQKEISGVVLTLVDISETKQAQQALLRETQRYEAVVRDQVESICRLDQDLRISFVNDAMCRAFDTRRDNLIGRDFLDFVREDYREKARNDFNSLRKNHPSLVGYPTENFDASVTWTQWTQSALYDSQGQILEYQLVGRDITAQKAAENALIESREDARLAGQRLYDAISNTSDGFAIFDSDGRLQVWNSAFDEVHSSKRIKIDKGVRYFELVRQAIRNNRFLDNKDTMEAFRKWARSAPHVDGPFEVERSDGRWLSIDSAETSEGGTVIIQKDITHAKLAQDHLAKRARQLARTNQDLEAFAFIVAHDLKTPLRNVRSLFGFIEEECRNTLNAQGQEYFDTAKDRLTKMGQMLEDLLAYSRIGMAEVELSTVDTGELVRGITKLFTESAHVTFNIGDNLPTIETAQTPLATVIRNLIDNAIKHHDRTLKLITIECEESGDHYIFSIADDGPGMPKELQDSIFVLFKTARKGDGNTGMGLTMIKRILEVHGGDIELVSKAGERGCCFRFKWPKAVERDLETLSMAG